ncbi:MAG: NUDIX hydrolase [Aeromicrobium sp.]
MRPVSDRGLRALTTWDGIPAAVRDAATIVLLRDGEQGLESFFLRRQPTMAFAAGMQVFPGGVVHDSDGESDIGWAGPQATEWADRLRCDVRTARALVVAAVRETFEESGVLLAGRSEKDVVSDTAPLEDERSALEGHELSFSAFLAQHDLVLRSDLLGSWAHWVTPEFEPRRFDTRFFVAQIPAGQTVGSLPGEADRSSWTSIAEALALNDAGIWEMMPPTRHTLRSLLDHTAATVVEAASRRVVTTIAPRLVMVDGQAFLDGPPAEEI